MAAEWAWLFFLCSEMRRAVRAQGRSLQAGCLRSQQNPHGPTRHARCLLAVRTAEAGAVRK